MEKTFELKKVLEYFLNKLSHYHLSQDIKTLKILVSFTLMYLLIQTTTNIPHDN